MTTMPTLVKSHHHAQAMRTRDEGECLETRVLTGLNALDRAHPDPGLRGQSFLRPSAGLSVARHRLSRHVVVFPHIEHRFDGAGESPRQQHASDAPVAAILPLSARPAEPIAGNRGLARAG
ncbi:hypothetical protein [Leucobacter chromiireducens]|uniref:hypothetical protein n=1 Tax=Leucobacter chromiireducens TaxID=283877 RepID=UPI0013DDA04E|nr:hypothetical protein [Leucobacter chromiireducens]